ncbi:MAG: 4-hydroxy-tetrahydrodipicolinate reductase [Oligoflexales bacterium]
MKSEQKNLWIFGISGRMGQEIQDLSHHQKQINLLGGTEEDTSLKTNVSGVGEADLVLDFSGANGNKALLNLLADERLEKKAILIGSTGISSEDLNRWKDLASEFSHNILLAPNTSLGIYLSLQAALNIASICTGHGFDLEIEETHHKHKKDSPSGTAVYLAKQLAEETSFNPVYGRDNIRHDKEIGVQATRGGGVFGEHKIRFLGEHEEISISHRAYSRTLFAKGALVLGHWILKQKPGLYQISDIAARDLIP